jgi:quinol monooxygenase YgiN
MSGLTRGQRLYARQMETGRREFLECLAALCVIGSAALEGPQGAKDMYGLIAKITAVAGKREEMIKLLTGATVGMPGCFSYVIAKDAGDENVIWVTEVWDSQASHDASLSLPAVKNAIPQSKALVAAFERIAVTTPVGGIGVGTASAR